MKKGTTFFLALLLLTGATELHQFIKIPLLLTHFQEHRKAEPGMTLIAFLKLHYASGEHPDDRDEDDDNQLPFRSMGTLQHTDILYSFRKEISFDSPEFSLKSSPGIHPEGHPSHRSFSIFHPPRLV
jgi:hypothetical protein